MTRLKEIAQAIINLPQKQLTELREWLEDYEAELWEAELQLTDDAWLGQAEFDASQEKLAAFADQAIDELGAKR